MRLIVFLSIAVTVIGIGGILVWTVARTPEVPATSNAPQAGPRKFDTTGGQTMRPRLNQDAGEGEADGSANN